jgi:sulfatase maturation enzyme AslB (radical SAM superfamily)
MMVTASGKPVRGEYWPCCNWTPTQDDILPGKGYDVENSSIEQFWQSDEMNLIRNKMLEGKPISGCTACYQEERMGTASLRQQENKGWSRMREMPPIKEVIDRWQETGVCDQPVSLDINFSSLCNLKCRMCFSGLSSELAKEQKTIVDDNGWEWKGHLSWEPLDMEIIDHGKNNKLMTELYDMMKNTKRIYLKGGEPSLLQTLYNYLDYPVDQGYAENIQIKFNTNMTNVQKRFVQLMDKFRKVDLTMSIDGVGAVQEYIRAPSKWSSISKNITYFIENNDRADLMVSPCWQIYNLFNIYEHLEWFNEMNKKRKVEVTPIILDYPMHFRIDSLPYEVRKQAVTQIKQCFKLPIASQPTLFKKLYTLLKMLEDTKENKEHLDKFVIVTKMYDKYRKQSIENSLPELYKHVKKYF